MRNASPLYLSSPAGAVPSARPPLVKTTYSLKSTPRIWLTAMLRELLRRRRELLHDLAPVLRRVNPYNKERSKREHANTLKRKALKKEISDVERSIAIELQRIVELPSNDPVRKIDRQRERRRNHRYFKEIISEQGTD